MYKRGPLSRNLLTSGPPKSYTKVHKTQKDQARQTNDKTHHPPNNSSTQHSCPFHDFNIYKKKKIIFS